LEFHRMVSPIPKSEFFFFLLVSVKIVLEQKKIQITTKQSFNVSEKFGIGGPM